MHEADEQWRNGDMMLVMPHEGSRQGDRAMNWDDDLPRPKRVIMVGDKLDQLSLAELDERVEALEAEIVRVKAEGAAKRALVSAAAALFKE
jgi:uncharacterized small protein (DUF1192 family)